MRRILPPLLQKMQLRWPRSEHFGLCMFYTATHRALARMYDGAPVGGWGRASIAGLDCTRVGARVGAAHVGAGLDCMRGGASGGSAGGRRPGGAGQGRAEYRTDWADGGAGEPNGGRPNPTFATQYHSSPIPL